MELIVTLFYGFLLLLGGMLAVKLFFVPFILWNDYQMKRASDTRGTAKTARNG